MHRIEGSLSWVWARLYPPTPEIADLRNYQRLEFQEQDKSNLFEFYPYDIFPTSADLAQLSAHAYENNFNRIKSIRIGNVIISGDSNNMDGDWSILAAAHSESDGYYGTAYYDTKRHHLVIAHKGTHPLSSGILGDLKCDIGGIPLAIRMTRVRLAFHFTCHMIRNFACISISITNTGHSLGGWLAQTTAFYLKYYNFATLENLTYTKLIHVHNEYDLRYCTRKIESLQIVYRSDICNHMKNLGLATTELKNGFHTHTIVFDSPSSRTYLDATLSRHRDSNSVEIKESEYNFLDITSFMGSHNFINSTGQAQLGLLKYISVNTHSIAGIAKVLREQPDSVQDVINTSISATQSLWWTVSKLTTAMTNIIFHRSNNNTTPNVNPNFRIEPQNPKMLCRMSLFNDEEQDLLNAIFTRVSQLKIDNENVNNSRLCRSGKEYFIEYLKIFESFYITNGVVYCDKNISHDPQIHSNFIKYIKCLCLFSPQPLSYYMKDRPTTIEVFLQEVSNHYLNQIPTLSAFDSSQTLYRHISSFLLNPDQCRVFGIYYNNPNEYVETEPNLATSLVASHVVGIINNLGASNEIIRNTYIGESCPTIPNGISTTKFLSISSDTLLRVQNRIDNNFANIFSTVGLVLIEVLYRTPSTASIIKLIRANTESKIILITSSMTYLTNLRRVEYLNNISINQLNSSDIKVCFDNICQADKNKIFRCNVKVQGKLHELTKLLMPDFIDFSSYEIMSFIKGDNMLEMGNILGKPRFYMERRFKLQTGLIVEGNTLIDMTQQIIVLVDVPGMGKSATMTNLFNNLIESEIQDWIIFIDLPKYIDFITIESTLETFLYNVEQLVDSKLRMYIFNNFLEQKKVQLLFDAFDEIPLEQQQLLLTWLRHFNVRKVWIATKPISVSLIESTLVDVQSIKFDALNDAERIEFILKSLQLELKNLEPLQVNNYSEIKGLGYNDFECFQGYFADFAHAALNHIINLIPQSDNTMRSPLELHLLAKANKVDFINYASKLAKESYLQHLANLYIKRYESRSTLYEEYIFAKYLLTLKKLGWPKFSKATKRQYNLVKKDLNQLHSKAGFYYIFCSEDEQCDKIYPKYESFLPTLVDQAEKVKITNIEDELELNRYGLIFEQNEKLRPVHYTLAKYFSANFYVDCPGRQECEIEFLDISFWNQVST